MCALVNVCVLMFCLYSVRLPCAKHWSNDSALPATANWLALMLVAMLPEAVMFVRLAMQRNYMRAPLIHHLHRSRHSLSCSILGRACTAFRRRCPLFSKWSIHWWISLRTENQCNCDFRKTKEKKRRKNNRVNHNVNFHQKQEQNDCGWCSYECCSYLLLGRRKTKIGKSARNVC